MGPSLRSHPLTLLQHFLPLDARTTGGYLGGWLPQSVMEWALKECRWKWFYSTLYLQFIISALALYLLLSLQIYSSLSCPKMLTCMDHTKGFLCPLVSVKFIRWGTLEALGRKGIGALTLFVPFLSLFLSPKCHSSFLGSPCIPFNNHSLPSSLQAVGC